ncbi:MAG: insulinase family protein [Bacteroidales bacterium]
MTLIKKTLCTLIIIMGAQFAYSQEYRVGDPLPIDKAYKIGKLENGLTYYIRKSENPAKRAEFFIIHNVGSLQENDNQRGLAHFLEHMAFNGTKNFPKKQLLEYFGGIGVKFGANINAYTSMDRTVYNLSSVPMERSSVIDSALLVLHDWSYYISCEPAEIEAERGVIREEWRRGDDSRTRMMKAFWKYEQSGSRFAERDVIGLMDVVNNFTPQTLIDYYHKWYRPDLQAIVVVGDFDVVDMEKRIIKGFSSIPKAVNPAPRESYKIPVNEKPIIGYITDPESSVVSVRITTKIPNLSSEAKQTNQLIYEELIHNLFLEIFKDRVEVAAEREDSCFRVAIPVLGSLSYAMTTFTVSAIPYSNSKNLLKSAKGVLTEIERVVQHGVEKEELESAVTRVSNTLEKNYNRNKKPKSEDFVNSVVENFTRNAPLVTSLDYYNISKECLKRITLEDFNAALPKFLTKENRVIMFVMPESDKSLLPSEEEVLKAVEEVSDAETERFIPVRKKGIEFTRKLEPVSILNSREITNRDIKLTSDRQLDSTVEMTLSNGAKVIWKEHHKGGNNVNFTAFKKGGYSLNQNILDIKLMDDFAQYYLVNGLNKQELTKWLQGRSISIKPNLSYRYSELSGSFAIKDSLDFFKLLNIYFTDINVDERDVKNMKVRMLKDLSESKKSRDFYNDSIAKLRYSYNPHDEKFTTESVESITSAKLLDLYKSVYSNPEGFTFVFSGPMSAKDAKPLIEKYIATISNPSCCSSSEDNIKYIYKEPKLNSGDIQLIYKGDNLLSSKASIARYYYCNMDYTASNYLNAKVFTYIMRERYMASIREERGGTYYVGVTNEMFRYPESIAQITIEFDTDPKLVDDLLGVVQQEFETFVKNGPTEKEIAEVKLYLEKIYQDRQKEDYSWTAAVSNAIQGNITFSEDEAKLLSTINAKSLQNFAKKVLKGKNRMTFVFEPKL